MADSHFFCNILFTTFIVFIAVPICTYLLVIELGKDVCVSNDQIFEVSNDKIFDVSNDQIIDVSNDQIFDVAAVR